MSLSPGTIFLAVSFYFLLLVIVSFFTSKDSSNANFFLAGRKSPWYLVAYGMIGASLSGVTFISIPGVVGAGGNNMEFSYMQMVFGYLLGYLLIATVLLPLYYRMNLTSIYTYLEKRFGFLSYKTGAGFFIVSRVIGAAFRLYLVAMVFQLIFDKIEGFNIPFWVTVLITILLIWLYTFKGGIKTIVWTDTLQTSFMLIAVFATIYAISSSLNIGLSNLVPSIKEAGLGQLIFFEGGWQDSNNFLKQFLGGASIAVVMTGLDQDMMQKNLSCKSLGDAQKNMFWFSIVLVLVNFVFLIMGALLYMYANSNNIPIPERTDLLFPIIALEFLSPAIGIFFVLGLIAAAYSSADSALTALTTSFCVDFLGMSTENDVADQKTTRRLVHIAFSAVLFTVIVIFHMIGDDSVINKLFKFAGFTYGPLLGLYTFGLFTKFRVNDNFVLPICLFAPIVTYFINANSEQWLAGYKFGFELLLVNGLLTFIGLLCISSFNDPVDMHAYDEKTNFSENDPILDTDL